MKNTKEAIRYGIETLGVTPDELFSLIESSEGYDGEDYKRWLSAKIIEIAEKDGVGYTQLLVKKFSIIQALAEEYSDDSIKEEWVRKFKKLLHEEERNIYSVDMEGVGDELEGVDWFNGIDLDNLNSDFVLEKLPDEVRERFLNDDNVTLFCKLSSESSDKNSELFKDAKNLGYKCLSEGALMLYRACSLVSAFEECTENFNFAFLSSTNFLVDKDNENIIKYFLSFFKYSGFTIDSTELLLDTFTGGSYAFVICKPRVAGDELQDGFVFRSAKLEDGKIVKGSRNRYSCSYNKMVNYLEQEIKENTDLYNNLTFYKLKDRLGKIMSRDEILGYLEFNNIGDMFISSCVDEGFDFIPITVNNFIDCVVYYGVYKSLYRFGFSVDITEFISGNSLYMELFYNCFVLFLCDLDNICEDIVYCVEGVSFSENKVKRNKLAIYSNSMQDYMEKGEVLFSFEAKQLLDVTKSIYNLLGDIDKNKPLKDLRVLLDRDDVNNQYLTALTSLKDYINTLYRKM